MSSTDTSAEAARIYRAAYLSLTGGERVERSMEMAEDVKEITLAGIRHHGPELTPDQVHREWLRILHGPAITKLLQ